MRAVCALVLLHQCSMWAPPVLAGLRVFVEMLAGRTAPHQQQSELHAAAAERYFCTRCCSHRCPMLLLVQDFAASQPEGVQGLFCGAPGRPGMLERLQLMCMQASTKYCSAIHGFELIQVGCAPAALGRGKL